MSPKPMVFKLPSYDGETRPVLISIVCWIGIFVNIVWLISCFMTDATTAEKLSYMGYQFGFMGGFNAVLLLIAFFGALFMKRWAIYLYWIVAILYLLWGIFISDITITSLVANAIVSILFLCYYSQFE